MRKVEEKTVVNQNDLDTLTVIMLVAGSVGIPKTYSQNFREIYWRKPAIKSLS